MSARNALRRNSARLFQNVLVVMVVVILDGLAANAAQIPQFTTPAPVTELNSPGIDWAPWISPDGLEAYFASDRDDSNYLYHIYRSTRSSLAAPFGAPVRVTEVNQTPRQHDPYLSSDGLTMYFSSYRNNPFSDSGIYAITRPTRSASWNSTTQHLVPGLNTPAGTLGWSGGPQIMPDGLTMYLHYQTGASTTMLDICVSTRSSTLEDFGTPKPLSELNSNLQDMYPFVTSDGLMIFFSSEQGAAGGMRSLFVAVRDSTDQPFGAPVLLSNLRSGTGEDKPFFHEPTRTLYFRSNRSDGMGDIFRCQLITPPSAGGLNVEWSTYLGGGGWDDIAGVVTDSNGHFFVAGDTDSTDFPGTSATSHAGLDAFVSKFNTSGTLLQTFYLGGNGTERVLGFAKDSRGNLLLTGSTMSTDFPTSGAYDTHYYGGGNSWGDAFVAKIRPDGHLIWSTYLGGTGDDYGWGIAADSDGNVYLTGQTYSSDFPTTGTFSRQGNGLSDCFVAKFSPTGRLLWSTCFGGGQYDGGYGLALDAAANIYIAGGTNSTDLPTTGGFDKQSHGGGSDGFIAKFTRDGSLLWSSYLGGNGTEAVESVAWDGGSHIYVNGETSSNDLPTTGGWDPTYNGGGDGFFAKVGVDGSLGWCSYFGGGGFDGCRPLTMDSRGNLYFIGYTSAADIPTTGGGDTHYHGGSLDAYLAKFDPQTQLLYCTLLGGNGRDEAKGIAADSSGSIYVAGHTDSTDFPTTRGWDKTYNGGTFDGFITKFGYETVPPTGPVNLVPSQADFSPAAPTQLRPGAPLILSAFIENTGGSAAGAFWTEVWGSRTGGLTLDRFLADSLWLPHGLPGSGSRSWVTTAPLYSIPDGPYTVLYAVDRPNDVAESNERDNRAVVRAKRLLVIRPQTQIDLAVEGFGLSPNPAQSGQAIALSGQVVNRGSEASGPFWIEFWGSWDWPYPNLNFFLCDSIYVENLAAGASVNLANYAPQLYGVPTGMFMVGCFADRDDAINELDETNNYQFVDGQVFNSAMSAARNRESEKMSDADIAVVSADISPVAPTQLAPGDTITLTTELANRGTGNSGPFWLEYWGSRDGGVTLNDFLAGSDRVANLAPGATVRLVFRKDLTGVPDGPYSVVVFADRPGDVSDSDESNNRRVIVGKRLLVIRPPTGANLVLENFGFYLPSWDRLLPVGGVRNTGSAESGPFWIEFWACPGDPDYPWLDRYLCDSVHVDNLAPGGTIELTNYERSFYKSLSAGQYAIICIVDRLDQVIETDETDNYQIVRNVAIPAH